MLLNVLLHDEIEMIKVHVCHFEDTTSYIDMDMGFCVMENFSV